MSNQTIKTTKIKICDIIKENDITYTFKCIKPKGFQWEAGTNGHFCLCPLSGDKTLDKTSVRHMSIMNLPCENCLAFTTKLPRLCSTYKKCLKELKKGDSLRFFGMSNHFPLKRENKDLVFISMGVGLATFRTFCLEIFKNDRAIKSLTSINIDRTGNRLYEEEFKKYIKKDYKNLYCITREDLYKQIDGTLTLNEALYYVVGSNEFLKSISMYLLKKGIDNEQINIDKKVSAKELIKLMDNL